MHVETIVDSTVTVSIFEYTDFRDYLLKAGLPDGKYSHQSNNLKKWSSRLGYKSPSTLAMVLRGQRLPSREMVEALVEDLKLNKSEKEYFELLIRYERLSQKNKDTRSVLARLSQINNKTQYHQLTNSQMEVLSEWYMLVIKNLAMTPSFREEPNWIHRALRKKVTVTQITYALKTLQDVGILKREHNGQLVAESETVRSSNDVPSFAISRHHLSMMQRAAEALKEQDVSQRQISGSTLLVNSQQVPEAKKAIYKFIEEFNEKFGQPDNDQVYQLNVQFFSHSYDSALRSQ